MSWKIVKFDKIDSTSDEAKRLIKSEKAISGQVILAKEQDNGHGRYGRVWQSPEGNLYASLLIKIDDDLQEAAQYSFVTAVVLGETLSFYLNEERKIEYKWPNDILVDGKKMSGILLESMASGNGDKWLVIGFGVNIIVTPEGVDKPVISLKECGVKNVSVQKLLKKFLQTFETQEKMWKSNGFSYIRERWLNCACKLGEQIRVDLSSKVVSGIFKGISLKGELEIEINKEISLIAAGDVFF